MINFAALFGAPGWVQLIVAFVGVPAFVLIVLGGFDMVNATVQKVAVGVFVCIVALQFIGVAGHTEGYRDRG